MVQHVLVSPTPPCPPPVHSLPDCGSEDYSKGAEVQIEGYRFRCQHVLGRGSFGEVWCGETLSGQNCREVALKDIACRSEPELQQALFEVNVLKSVQSIAGESSCIPQYYAHKVVQKHGSESRVRFAMARVPGEALDAFLARPQCDRQDGPAAVRRGCAMATQLITQLGPTLERVGRIAWHRDVNSHNILVSDAISGGVAEADVSPDNMRFWMIDFGLAVDSRSWPSKWSTSDIGGDCRYWPPSSWLMSFHGAEALMQRSDLRQQYETRLDIFGLGVLALEMMCVSALAADDGTGATDGLRGAWRRLLTAWTKYRRDVTRWHTTIYKVFSVGGDIGPVYVQLRQERVVDRVLARLSTVRTCLRACVDRAHDPMIKTLLWVIGEMLDESSTVGLSEVVRALGGDVDGASRSTLPPRPQNTPNTVRQELGHAQNQWRGLPTNLSYTPPAAVAVGPSPRPVHVESSKSFTPRDGSVPAAKRNFGRANLAGA